jgi:GNAT superfamily N-acetyltransferase
MSLLIRNATHDDEPQWRALWSGYCTFYKAVVPDPVTQSTWERIMSNPARIGCRVALWNDQAVGLAHHVLHEGTWVIEPIAYLEDLFVEPAHRKHGIGKALIDDLLAMAKDRGWSRVYWHTQQDNHTARTLYDRYALADPFVRYTVRL